MAQAKTFEERCRAAGAWNLKKLRERKPTVAESKEEKRCRLRGEWQEKERFRAEAVNALAAADLALTRAANDAVAAWHAYADTYREDV